VISAVVRLRRPTASRRPSLTKPHAYSRPRCADRFPAVTPATLPSSEKAGIPRPSSATMRDRRFGWPTRQSIPARSRQRLWCSCAFTVLFINTRNTNKQLHVGNKVGRPKTANQSLLMRGGTTREDKTEHETAKKDHIGARTRAATRWGRGACGFLAGISPVGIMRFVYLSTDCAQRGIEEKGELPRPAVFARTPPHSAPPTTEEPTIRPQRRIPAVQQGPSQPRRSRALRPGQSPAAVALRQPHIRFVARPCRRRRRSPPRERGGIAALPSTGP
jgi:hypothetical protein